jgi:small subunit ribosomal protein S18
VARSGGGDRDRRRAPKDTARRGKKKVCIFCKEHIEWVDYKDVNLLRRFMSDRGKIRARRVSGNCAQHQRDVAIAIKTARELALLPYTQRTVAERAGPRVRRDSGPRADIDDRGADSGDGGERDGIVDAVGDEPAFAGADDDLADDDVAVGGAPDDAVSDELEPAPSDQA